MNLLDELIEEAFDVYRSIPKNVKIILSYSGGKDSTTFVVLATEAIKLGFLDKNQVEVVYADTLLEMPNLHQQAINFLKFITDEFGIKTTIVKPKLNQTYWVRFLGEGTYATNHFNRWCVKPLKIDPIKRYFKSILAKKEEYIVVIGIRLDESQVRTTKYKDVAKIPKYSCDTQGECFAPLDDEPRAYPILNWKNCNIWDFLQFHDFSYNYPVQELRSIYFEQDNARYGCWNCTVVSSKALILKKTIKQNPALKPLLELRKLQHEYTSGYGTKFLHDWIYILRIKGKYKGKWVPSRITVDARQRYLEKILKAQKQIRNNGEPNFTIISKEEENLIRKLWLKWPDGDVKGRKWCYFKDTLLYLQQTRI